MGKSFEIRNPNSKATDSQTYAIYSATGVDVRPCKLKKGQASNIIDDVKNGRGAYFVRDDMVALGGAVRKRDVGKHQRSDPKVPKAKAVKKAAPKRTSERTTKKSAQNIPNVPDATEIAAALKLLEGMGMQISVGK